jgi:hypothetical protein
MKFKLIIASLLLSGIALAQFLQAPDIARIEATSGHAAGDEPIHLAGKSLAALNIIAANTQAGADAAADYGTVSVIASTDGTPTYAKTSNTISALSAQPVNAASALSVTINGTTTTLPAGVGYAIDSGSPAVKFSTPITCTVTAGTVVFTSRN